MKRFLAALFFLVAGTASAQHAAPWIFLSDSWIFLNGGAPLPSGYLTIQANGTNLTQRSILNFTTNMSCSDNAGTVSTVCSASGAGGGLADPGSNGIVVRTALNVTSAVTIACTAGYCSWTNGSGVGGNPTLTLALTQANDAGAIIKQATTPGTQQGSGGNANINHNGTQITELDGIGATPTDAHIVQNTTAASLGAQQYSPASDYCGQGWGTTSSTNEKDCWRAYTKPVQGGTSTSLFNLDSSLASGAFANEFSLTSGGQLTIPGALIVTSNGISITGGQMTLPQAGLLTWGNGGNRSTIQSPADGVIEMTNHAATAFTRLELGGTTSSFVAMGPDSAATVLKVMLADASAYAEVNASLYGSATPSTISSASTIAPTTNLNIVSGTTQITTITVPTNFQGGCIYLVPSGLWTTGTSGNISIATTAVVSKTLVMCWDGTKWDPSY